MASIALCNDRTFSEFSMVKAEKWPSNHVTMNIAGMTTKEVGKRVVRWLCKSGDLVRYHFGGSSKARICPRATGKTPLPTPTLC